MSANRLIPAVDVRLGSLLEFTRRNEAEKNRRGAAGKMRPTITLSREFGCEGYPVSECLKEMLEKKSGEDWVVMDKALLEETARNHNLSAELLTGLGEKARFLDEILATFSPHWKTEKDYFKLICRQMLALAEKGNVILVGRGGAIVTQSLKNCHHFRMFASMQFKVRSISKRAGIAMEEAEAMIRKKQKQRDAFIHDFMDRDARDLCNYNLIFNNDRNTAEKIAATIAGYVLSA